MWPPTLAPTEKPAIVVVDNFYARPDDVRAFALSQEFNSDPKYFRGKRSASHLFPYVRERFQELLGVTVADWVSPDNGANGMFQYCVAGDETVFHSDGQRWAGAVYLTPGAPPDSGTVFYRSRITRLRAPATPMDALDHEMPAECLDALTYNGNLTDRTKWEEVDRVGNVYNRLVLWNARLIHSAGRYFGSDKETGRLFQLFFFNSD